MFKSLILYRIGAEMPASADALEADLERAQFAPCAPTEPLSAGFVAPRGHAHGALVEVVDGQWIIRLQTEQRLLPPSVIADRVEELCAHIEDQTGRKPGKKALKDLKEQATHELLPQAFTRRRSMLCWIDPETKLLAVDAASGGRADEFASLLIKTISVPMNLHLMQSAETPSACMAAWLMDGEPPADFNIDRESELKSEDESKSVVRYQRHALDIDEVRQHLQAGKRPTRLAMTWRDRVSFLLTDELQLRKINFLDLCFEGRATPEKDDAFDADVALATGELRELIPALIEALGGEHELPILAAADGKDVSCPAPHMPSDGDDPLYEQAVAVVREHKRASISLVQRYLKIGYNRAARLLEQMEKAGVVSPMRSDGGRALLMPGA